MDRQEYRQRFAARLRGARAESGLSQKDVEAVTGMSTSELSRVENAKAPPDRQGRCGRGALGPRGARSMTARGCSSLETLRR